MQDAPEETPPRILVVDDEEVIREILADFLSMEGFEVAMAADGSEALRKLGEQAFDLVLSDLKMPNLGGIQLLESLSAREPPVITIIMTGFGTVETAIDAMKRGAYDYIMKPFKMEEVVHTVRRGLERRKLEAENLQLKETLSLFKVNEAVADTLDVDAVVTTAIEALMRELKPDAVLALVRGRDGQLAQATHVAAPSQTDAGELDVTRLASHLQAGHLRVHGVEAASFFARPPRDRAVSSLMAVPLRVGGRSLGYLVAMSSTPGRKFEEGQRKLLTIVSNRTAAALDNAKLYGDLQASFHQTIEGLASFMDTMDQRTAGHSQRVAVLCRHLAAAVGLSAGEVELIRQAALMHDVGKIGCALKLNEPEPLTAEELARLRQHPAFGKEILEPIHHLRPLIPGVHLHHERWDGSGYPLGLRGEDIPLMARIIAVADAYDAMTSQRSYRQARTHADALVEMRRCAATEFDPKLVEVFLDVVDRARDDLVAQRTTRVTAASGGASNTNKP